MAKSRKLPINIQFPLAGLNTAGPHSNQAPYTSTDLQNVRGDDTIQSRARGGQRGGFSKAYEEQLGSGAPVRLMAQVDTADETAQYYFSDNFDRDGADTLGSGWSTASWLSNSPSTTISFGGLTETYAETGAVRDALDVDITSEYNIDMRIVPFGGEQRGTYKIFARMDDTTPDVETEGVVVELTLDGATGTYDGRLIEFNAGVPTAYSFTTSGSDGGSYTGWFKVNINSDIITVSWRGTTLLTQAVTTHASKRLGFGMRPADSGEITMISSFRVYGTPGTARPSHTKRVYLVASAGGNLYCEKTLGAITQVAGATLASTHQLMAAQRHQILYIANYSVDGSALPKTYDPKNDTFATWTATVGTVPTSCSIVELYRDRIVLVPDGGFAAYFSRQGDPNDWDFGQQDARAAYSTQTTLSGILGERMTAMKAFTDDFLIMGCVNSIWCLRGDPQTGGTIDNIDKESGIVGRFALCRGPNGELFYMSRFGLYALPPGGGSMPTRISENSLPKELQSLDTVNKEVVLEWNNKDNGVNIFLTPEEAGPTEHWFFSLDYKGFFRDTTLSAHDPFTAFNMKSDYPDQTNMLVGCRDGYIRYYDDLNETDDGSAITSYCDYGPFRLAQSDFNEGILLNLQAVLAKGSGPVTWAVRVGNSHETVSASNFTSGTWSTTNPAEEQYLSWVDARGGSAIVRVTSSGSRTWSVEKIFGDRKIGGPLRQE